MEQTGLVLQNQSFYSTKTAFSRVIELLHASIFLFPNFDTKSQLSDDNTVWRKKSILKHKERRKGFMPRQATQLTQALTDCSSDQYFTSDRATQFYSNRLSRIKVNFFQICIGFAIRRFYERNSEIFSNENKPKTEGEAQQMRCVKKIQILLLQ